MRGRGKVPRSQKYVATHIWETAEILAALELLLNKYNMRRTPANREVHASMKYCQPEPCASLRHEKL